MKDHIIGHVEAQARDYAKRRIDATTEADPDSLQYGLPYGDLHPHDYLPDLECCTEDERQRWVNACVSASLGRPFEAGNHTHGFTSDGQIIIGATERG